MSQSELFDTGDVIISQYHGTIIPEQSRMSPHCFTAVGGKNKNTTNNTFVPEDLMFKPSNVRRAGETLLSPQHRETDSIITFQLGRHTKQAESLAFSAFHTSDARHKNKVAGRKYTFI